jgi:hypothetical protein
MINIKIKEAADILNAGLWGTYDWDKPIKGVSTIQGRLRKTVFSYP